MREKNKRNTQEYSDAVSPLLVSVLLLKGAPWNYAFHYHIFSFLSCHEAVSKTILSSKRQYNIILYIWKIFKIKIFQKPVTNSWTIQYHLVCMENFQNKNTSKTSNKFMGNKQARVLQNIKLYMRASCLSQDGTFHYNAVTARFTYLILHSLAISS